MQQFMPQPRAFSEELRQKAAEHSAAQIDLQSIVFQQGRSIARAYADMMKSYAGLTAQAGRYEQRGERLVISGICRIEQEHFGKEPLLVRRRREQSILNSRISELIAHKYDLRGTDLFEAFRTGLAEFCAAEGIRLGNLSVLVRKKDGTTVLRELPAVLNGSEYAESLCYPYEIEF